MSSLLSSEPRRNVVTPITSSRSVTDYFYDPAGKLASSAKRSRMQDEGQPSSAERLTETDSYFIDANGKVFITLQEFRDYGRPRATTSRVRRPIRPGPSSRCGWESTTVPETSSASHRPTARARRGP